MQPGQPASTLVTADTRVKRGHGLRRRLETETTTKVAAVRAADCLPEAASTAASVRVAANRK